MCSSHKRHDPVVEWREGKKGEGEKRERRGGGIRRERRGGKGSVRKGKKRS